MKDNYDFSKGVRGKFYRPGAEFHIPVYLDPDNLAFVENLAKQKKTNVSAIVNDLIRTDKNSGKSNL